MVFYGVLGDPGRRGAVPAPRLVGGQVRARAPLPERGLLAEAEALRERRRGPVHGRRGLPEEPTTS